MKNLHKIKNNNFIDFVRENQKSNQINFKNQYLYDEKLSNENEHNRKYDHNDHTEDENYIINDSFDNKKNDYFYLAVEKSQKYFNFQGNYEVK